jgi:hypothetical protein
MVVSVRHRISDAIPLRSPAPGQNDDQGDTNCSGCHSEILLHSAARVAPASFADGKDPLTNYYPRTTDALRRQPVVIRGGEELGSYDIEMQAASSFKISGTIISSVTPPNGRVPSGQLSALRLPRSTSSRATQHPGQRWLPALGTVQLSQSGDHVGARLSKSRDPTRIYDLSTWFANRILTGGASITIGRTPLNSRQGPHGVGASHLIPA